MRWVHSSSCGHAPKKKKHCTMTSPSQKVKEETKAKPINLMELGLEEESRHGGPRLEKSSLVENSHGDTEHGSNVRDIRRRNKLLVHAPSVGLILSSIAALAIGALIGNAANKLRSQDNGGTNNPLMTSSDITGDTSHINNLSINTTYPPLDDLVQGNEIVGDVSWELDFAIIGYPKCGTSYLMRYLSLGEELYLHDHELCTLTFNDPARLATMYHGIDRVTQDGRRRVKVGLKCPKDAESDWGLQHYSTYWPNTDFIVTTRHPVSWFQSFYNYRSYQHYPKRMHDPLDLIGPCRDDHPGQICAHKVTPKSECWRQNVCTDRSNFHHALSRLRKTPMNTTRELELLKDRTMDTMGGLNGRVFIMEVGQLAQTGEAATQFTRDLSQYLGMQHPLPPFPPHTTTYKYEDEEKRQDFINICEDRFIPVRAELLKGGAAAAEWIRDYFLVSDGVHVSQKDVFLDLLSKWSIDPCEHVEAL